MHAEFVVKAVAKMIIPSSFSIIYNLIQNNIPARIAGLAGIIVAIFLHRSNKGEKFWPALLAILIYLACEVVGVNVFSYLIEFIALEIGSLTFCFAVSWIVIDVIYICKKR